MRHIYGLCDPRSGCLLYIGQSRWPERRLFEHLGDAVRSARPKDKWVRELVMAGLAPTLVLLESVPDEQANVAEQFYIALFRALGAKLVNAPTRRGFALTTEHKSKVAAAAKQRRIPQAQRDKIAAALRGRAKSAEHRANMTAARRARCS